MVWNGVHRPPDQARPLMLNRRAMHVPGGGGAATKRSERLSHGAGSRAAPGIAALLERSPFRHRSA